MPNANTDPGVTQGSPPTLPHARDTGHPFDRLRHYQDVLAYALRNYDHAIERASRLSGTSAQLWADCAEAYLDAYQEILALEGLPDAESFPRARDMLHEANHRCDEA